MGEVTSYASRSRKSVSLALNSSLETSSQRTREFPRYKDLFPSLDNAVSIQEKEDELAAVWEPSFCANANSEDYSEGVEIIEVDEEEDEENEEENSEEEEEMKLFLETLEKVKESIQNTKNKEKKDNANKLLKLLEETLND